ncbi:MAG: FecCD family ABC transporter permease [Desertimonas sp.]
MSGGALARADRHAAIPGLEDVASREAMADIVRVTRPSRRIIGLLAMFTVLVMVMIASLALGARDIPIATVIDAVRGALPGDDYESLVIGRERIPRTVLGVITGAALGASGAIMQGVTRNPLADPGVLGIESGAGLFVVIGIVFTATDAPIDFFWWSLAGSFVTAAVVWVISRSARSMSTEVSLVLAGATVAGLIASVITLVTIRDAATSLRYRGWAIGVLTGQRDAIAQLWPFVAVGLIAALALGGTLNALSLGDDVAAALGTNVTWARLRAVVVAVVLCAAATAALGPVAFVGLVAGHLARMTVGGDYRWVLPYAAVSGALVLLTADVLGRLAPGRGEVEVGVMTAVVGAPFFIGLSRRRRAQL